MVSTQQQGPQITTGIATTIRAVGGLHQDPIGLNGGLNYHAYAPNPTGWTDSLGLTPASFAANVARIKAGQSVTVCSYKEAQALLFGAFPDAQKSARRR